MQHDNEGVVKVELTDAEKRGLAARWERLRSGFPALRRAAAGEEPLFDVNGALRQGAGEGAPRSDASIGGGAAEELEP